MADGKRPSRAPREYPAAVRIVPWWLMADGSPALLLALDARLLIGVRGLLGQGMHPPVDVCIVAGVVIHNSVNNLPWGLGGSCIVEIYQRLSVNLAMQYREVLPYFCNVKHRG